MTTSKEARQAAYDLATVVNGIEESGIKLNDHDIFYLGYVIGLLTRIAGELSD